VPLTLLPVNLLPLAHLALTMMPITFITTGASSADGASAGHDAATF
jgi:hypothetical protein